MLRATNQESDSMRLRYIAHARTSFVTAASRRASSAQVCLVAGLLATSALVGACSTSASDRQDDALVQTGTTTTTTRAMTPAGGCERGAHPAHDERGAVESRPQAGEPWA